MVGDPDPHRVDGGSGRGGRRPAGLSHQVVGASSVVKSAPRRSKVQSRSRASSGTSTAFWVRAESGTMSSARSWVEARTTGAATPSRKARSQFGAVTHHRSPGRRPGNRNWGAGVDRSLPIDLWWARNSSVITAQMVWLPRSWGPVVQHPSRWKPVTGSVPHSSSGPPSTFRSRSVRDIGAMMARRRGRCQSSGSDPSSR